MKLILCMGMSVLVAGLRLSPLDFFRLNSWRCWLLFQVLFEFFELALFDFETGT